MRRKNHQIDISSFKEAVSRLCSQSVFVIDFDSHKVLYQSDQMIYIDDATKRDIKREHENPYFSLVSEETFENLIQIQDECMLINSLLSKDDCRNHISITHFPIELRNNKIFISQKFTPLSIDEDGKIKTGMFAVSPSANRSMDSLLLTPSDRRFKFDFERGMFYEYNLNKDLTITEKAIIQKSRMGMTTDEIAESLGISINTVKTHKMRIFRKLGVNSVEQLLSFVGTQRLH